LLLIVTDFLLIDLADQDGFLFDHFFWVLIRPVLHTIWTLCLTSMLIDEDFHVSFIVNETDRALGFGNSIYQAHTKRKELFSKLIHLGLQVLNPLLLCLLYFSKERFEVSSH
jgi:hypothetical protein